jgi:hypothetical protein
VKAARKDPAEQSGYLRYFYRDWKTTRLGRMWNRAFAFVAGFGLLPELLVTLQVRDRTSGRLYPTLLVGAQYEGQRYLVSMLGEHSGWVENVRAADGKAFIKRWRPSPVKLTEIAIGERAPILRQWVQVATSGRRHLPVSPDAPLSAFEAIASDYPVFRIDSAAAR